MTRLLPTAAGVVPEIVTGGPVLAHGTGPGHDLPVPLFYALAGGALAVFVSFLAMGALWPESRLRGAAEPPKTSGAPGAPATGAPAAEPPKTSGAPDAPATGAPAAEPPKTSGAPDAPATGAPAAAGRPLPALTRFADAPATRWTLKLATLALAVAVVVRGAMLPDSAHANPVPSVVYGVFWVGLVFASLAFGPVWRVLNPLRTVHAALSRVLRRDPRAGVLALPGWIGYWPAALGLLAFVWMELVSFDPDSVPALARFFLIYTVVHLAAASVFGSRWFDRGDAFEVLSDLVGRLAFVGRCRDGAIVLRGPLHGLDSLRPAPGLVTVVCVLLASTAYDSVTALWTYGTVRAGTAGLALAVVVVLVLYGAAAASAGLIGGRRRVVAAFAHSLVPVAVGYLIAHYLAYLLSEAQRAAVLMAGSPAAVEEELLPAGVLAVVQVAAIVVGHVLGVMSAHDRAVRLFEPRVAIAGQVPLMVLMVIVTVTGLTLLASG